MHRLITILFLGLCSLSVSAHNVVGGVYAIGNQIEGEVGFSNGDMAAAGTLIKVTDAEGNELANIKTNDEGLFSYTATRRIDHLFFANLSSGHLLELTLPAAELPDSLPSESVTGVNLSPQTMEVVAPSVTSSGQKTLEQMVERAVAKQVIPLRKELAEYKEKASLQDVIGGIGYIFGLCGLGIWWRQRQLDKQSKG
ncbi:hypothetical protein [Neptuniibacter marinus]|uniref:hypothetical protein n=1 Tax=Neptuniibacter marinus TaxID=1806670 RepID=UPI0008337B19|nr:hypothetical protein [Neptuniibacter marinus]